MRDSRIKALIWLGMTMTACGSGSDSAPRRESTGEGKVHNGAAQRPGGAALRPDSTTIVVAGPTLIVFFKSAYTAADSGGDNAEALSDLEYHLGSARPTLDSLGVTVEERYGDVIDYVVDAVTHRFKPAPDSGRQFGVDVAHERGDGDVRDDDRGAGGGGRQQLRTGVRRLDDAASAPSAHADRAGRAEPELCG